jgi:glycosyltransferase involved in cell wall biosynthesis
VSTVFVSSALDGNRIPFGGNPGGETLGKAHYSWHIVSELYGSGIRAAGRQIRNVLRPEIYQTAIARNLLGYHEGDMHFAVKPIEHLRPIHGVRNVFVCGWEFPEFSEHATESDPFKNQLAVLRNADLIVCWTDYTVENLRKHGLQQVTALPPPVMLAPAAVSGSLLEMPVATLNTENPEREASGGRLRNLGTVLQKLGPGKVLVSVLNPFDRRKQLSAMLTGFMQALRDDPDAVLLVKLIIDNDATRVYNINELLPMHMDFKGVCPRVVFIGEQLSKSQMHAFLKLGSHYLCTSSAEGLNLPLIEAMLAGVPPVSTRNTAMGTYLDDSISIGIRSSAQPMTGAGHALSDHLAVTHFPPGAQDVAVAIGNALQQADADRAAMGAKAKQFAVNKFGMQAFVSKFDSTF